MSISTKIIVIGNKFGTNFLAYDENSDKAYSSSMYWAHKCYESDDLERYITDAKEVLSIETPQVYEIVLDRIDLSIILEQKRIKNLLEDKHRIDQFLATLTDSQKQILIGVLK